MKKLFTFILMAAVLFTACTKENMTIVDQIVTINATIASDTKVALGETDETKVNWTKGDIICLTINEVDYYFQWQEETRFTYLYLGKNLPTLTQGMQIKAAYIEQFSIEQTGLKPDVGNYMKLSTETTVTNEESYENLNLTFSHGTSVLKLTLKNNNFKNADVTDITLKANAADIAKATGTFKGTEADGSVTVYFALQPSSLTNITIHATCNSKEYMATMGNDKSVESGKLYTANVDMGVMNPNYIDEYGVNHGPGVEIDGVVWAPVNCGYHVTDYPYGKLYQWGRRHGQGYDTNDASQPTCKQGPFSLSVGNSDEFKNYFIEGTWQSMKWLSPETEEEENVCDKLWNFGTEENPVKTQYDPCPDNWRIPTARELDQLKTYHSSWSTNAGQKGYWFSGLTAYSTDVARVFFPAAGYRDYSGTKRNRTTWGYYWSSKSDYGTYGPSASNLEFDSGNVIMRENTHYRASGSSVRCVQIQ